MPKGQNAIDLNMLKKSFATIRIILIFFFLMSALLSVAEAAAPKNNKYLEAEASYNNLLNNPSKVKYRHNWLNCIKQFQKVGSQDPAGLYMAGKIYLELFKRSGIEGDKKEARDLFEQVIKRYPASEYKLKAEGEIQQFSAGSGVKPSPPVKTADSDPKRADSDPKTKERVVSPPEKAVKESRPVSPPPVIAPLKTPTEKPRIIKTGLATVSGLRYWSNPTYTRIVIDADQDSEFTHQLIQKDSINNKPQRICVDVENSRLAHDIKKFIPINDNLLSDIRAAQYTLEAVRVVVDIKSFNTYKVFSLRNPFRIVVDVWGMGTEEGAVAVAKPEERPAVPVHPETPQPLMPTAPTASTVPAVPPVPAVPTGPIGKNALAQQLVLGVKRVVIDAGHGGKDFGAPGYLSGVHEKDVTLQIAKRLADKIHDEIGCDVVMTRNTDKYLTLEERTAIANTNNADLFISIHTNSHRDSRAFGLETYFLNLATDNDAILVAARENATSTKNISDLQTILNDLMQNAKINESSRLAAYVQGSLYQGLSKSYDSVKNKGVKQAPFYVLLGAQMPAILVETSFISNPRECERLVNHAYQDRLADAIIAGMKTYIKEINPTAFSDRLHKAGEKG